MGKGDNRKLPISQQSDGTSGASRNFFCHRCPMGIRRILNLKCVAVLIFSVAAFLSAVFFVLPLHYGQVGFDAKDYIKLSDTVLLQIRYVLNPLIHNPNTESSKSSLSNLSFLHYKLSAFLHYKLSASLHPVASLHLVGRLRRKCRRRLQLLILRSLQLPASVQAHFKLQKPVSELLPYIARIEYDVNGEIGVPSLKVAVLSMHPAKLPNMTDVVFGFLPDPINSTINPVYLSVLKSSLIELFLQEYNLTLTSSIFGEPSSFEILKFPGGITIIPERDVFVSQIPQVLFNFTLNSTINDIKDNIQQLKPQLKSGLHLMPNEVVYIQVKSKNGSTKDPPVTVEAYVSSNLGTIMPERLRQLAQTISGSPPTENLGLDRTVFGEVKEISLSSILNHFVDVPAPTSSPCPSPSMTPSYSPAFSPVSNPPAHSVIQCTTHCGGSTDSPSPSPTSIGSPLAAFSPQISPSSSPFSDVAYDSQDSDEMSGNRLVSRHVLLLASSDSSCTWRISQWQQLFGSLAFLLFWIS